MLTLGTAVVSAVSAIVAVVRSNPALAALGFSAVSLVLAAVGVVFVMRALTNRPKRPASASSPPPAAPHADPEGRTVEVTNIGLALDDESTKEIVVRGRRGVGTSACAGKAVKDLGGEDHYHYVDLRPGGVPLTGRAVRSRLAISLGLAPDADAGQIRAALAAGGRQHGRLLFLDNADDKDQLSCLPHVLGPDSTVLVAGTVDPGGRERVDVPPLRPIDAARLLHGAARGNKPAPP